MRTLQGTDSARVLRFFKKIFNGQIFMVLFPDLSFRFLRRRYQAHIKNLAGKKLPFVVRMDHGGLGDQIVWSALPEALFKKYGIKTEISSHSAFRSEEIKNFMWNGNPCVSFTSAPGITVHFPHTSKYKNYNEILLAMFGLEGPLFRMSYRPLARPDVADKVLCDLSLGPSHTFNESGTRKFWDAVAAYLTEHFKKEDIMLIEPTSPYPDKRLTHYIKEKLQIPTLPVNSINELADVLCSAKERVLLDSGSKSVAAAYGKHSVVLIRGFVNMYFKYEENDYIHL
jgi:hypothetical protein